MAINDEIKASYKKLSTQRQKIGGLVIEEASPGKIRKEVTAYNKLYDDHFALLKEINMIGMTTRLRSEYVYFTVCDQDQVNSGEIKSTIHRESYDEAYKAALEFGNAQSIEGAPPAIIGWLDGTITPIRPGVDGIPNGDGTRWELVASYPVD